MALPPMVYSLDLEGAAYEGQIWKYRPAVHASGLVCIFKNRRHRPDDVRRPPFSSVSFNKTGDIVAAADPLGQVYVFFLRRNRFCRIKRPGVGVTLLAFSPTRQRELFVACEDRRPVQCCGWGCFAVDTPGVRGWLRTTVDNCWQCGDCGLWRSSAWATNGHAGDLPSDSSTMCAATPRTIALFPLTMAIPRTRGMLSRVLCYDVQSRSVFATLRAHKEAVHSVAFHPSGRSFATASEGACILWDNSDWTRKRCVPDNS